MTSLQRRIATLTDTTANLVRQLRELQDLREQIKKARLSVKRTRRAKRRNGHRTTSRIPLESSARTQAFGCSIRIG
jgi:predicted  nucleic acid-binding Zn-ribbon protein